MMWQPIETAPKRDDVQILTFHADFAPKHGRNKLQKESCYWYQTSFWSEKFGLFVGWPLNIQPTHWMELPAPPLPAQDWKKEPAHVPPLVEWAKGLQSNAERVPDNTAHNLSVKQGAEIEALQAENAQWRVDFKEMVIERDAALARLSEIERQEPVGYLYDWAHSSATGRDDETYTGFTKDKAHAEKHDNAIAIYASAGASPVEPSESVEHRDELAKRKPEPAAETVGGLAKAVKAARGGDAPPAPMRRFA